MKKKSAAVATTITSPVASPPVDVNPAYSTTPDTLVPPSQQPLDATPRGGVGSNGSRGSRGSRDNGGGDGDGNLGGSSIAEAPHNTQTTSTPTPALLYVSTRTTNPAAAEVGGGAASTRVAERNMRGAGGGELMGQFGPGDAPVALLGSHDSPEDREEIRRRGFNALGEGSGTNDHVRAVTPLCLFTVHYLVVLYSLNVWSSTFSLPIH